MSNKETKAESTEQVKETKAPKDDNLVDVLQDFNTGKSSSKEEESVKVQESNKEESTEKSDDWLINNKFKNDEEGVKKLATAYKELQGASQKKANEYESRLSRVKDLEQLDKLLKANPSVVSAIEKELQNMNKKATEPPKKPDDYDILDETVDGTSSNKWRKQYDAYLVDSGKVAAKQEVNALRNEMAKKEAMANRVNKLKDLGLSGDDINSYFKFMTEKKNLTDENFVPIWQHLSGKKNFSTSSQNVSENTIQEPKRVSAAAVEGSVPETIKSDDKVRDEFWGGIMKSARKL